VHIFVTAEEERIRARSAARRNLRRHRQSSFPLALRPLLSRAFGFSLSFVAVLRGSAVPEWNDNTAPIFILTI